MKKYYFLIGLSVWLFFFALFVVVTMYNDKTMNNYYVLVITSGVLILVLPFFAMFKFLEMFLEERRQRNERVEKYGKYLRAAGLPEDIKDVLGHFVSYEIKIWETNKTSDKENVYQISKCSFLNSELKLILHEHKGSEDLFINIRSDDSGKIFVELKIDEGLPAVSNLIPSSIKIL